MDEWILVAADLPLSVDETRAFARTAEPDEIQDWVSGLASAWAEALGAPVPESWVAWRVVESSQFEVVVQVRIEPPEGSRWDLVAGRAV